MNQKTGFIWSVIAIEILYIIFSALMFYMLSIFDFSTMFGASIFEGFMGIILSVGILTLVASIIYTIKLFKMSSDIIRWTHIVFFLNALIAVMSAISQFTDHQMYIGWIGTLIILALLWYSFSSHLKKNILSGRINLQ